MQKKKSKKSWLRNNLGRYCCNCHYCTGDWFKRFLEKTRVRQKFFKNEKIDY